MNRENKRRTFEKGYYKTHACTDSFTCRVCGRLRHRRLPRVISVTARVADAVARCCLNNFFRFFRRLPSLPGRKSMVE